MIIKHFFTCSVIVLIAIIFKLTVSSPVYTPATANQAFNPQFITFNNGAENTRSFADEALPTTAGVNKKLKRSITRLNYAHIGSNKLHLKARRLFAVIEPILHAYHIPDDFKYLPLVESGLDGGYSVKGARGVWQFMPGTARYYGLKVNQKVDERTDIRKSTIAACKYIGALHHEFKSWTLAAAAYNNGEIKLAKAMHEQNQKDYYAMHLNRETGAYVYNVMAMKTVIVQPEKHGYTADNNFMPDSRLLAYKL